MAYKITVDTGGTFTDVVVSGDGVFTLGKSLTTHNRVVEGMTEAMQSAADELGLSLAEMLSQTDVLIYGTTRAINAIVTSNTAKTALLTTQGFPDVLVLKEGGKANPHDFTRDFPEPYIPRRLTFEIHERTTSEAEVSVPLDEAHALNVIEELKAQRIEAVAVMFLWSMANPANEIRMGELLQKHLPEVPVTLSHQLIPIIREYRRASATAIDASLKPLMQTHLIEMEKDLRSLGYKGEILVSTSMGGCLHVEELVQQPIHAIKSGPSMAPLAGRVFASLEDAGGDVIIADTGGTTFDVGLVRGGNIKFSREAWIGEMWTGHNLGTSAVDIRSVGSGGGSIAWIDSGGLLRVGPRSAGSEPGPCCYGRGGTEPTVTDAACVLGYIDPEFFLGGKMVLDGAAARRAVGVLADQLGLSLIETAYAIIRISSETMIKAIADITISEGHSPSESVLVAGGGAAGLNIGLIAAELGCDQVIIPKTASVLSASGMQYADIVTEEAATSIAFSNDFDRGAINSHLDALEGKLTAFLDRLSERQVSVIDHKIEYFVEARYMFQVWELEVSCPTRRIESAQDEAKLVDAFHVAHERVFSVRDPNGIVEFLNWRARLSVSLAKPDSNRIEPRKTSKLKPTRSRETYFDGAHINAAIYRGERLEPGHCVHGPAIIEEPTTTIVVYPGMKACVSSLSGYILETQSEVSI